jgi:bleomycin hydrolase
MNIRIHIALLTFWVSALGQAQNNLPKGYEWVSQIEHTSIKSQDNTGTCWSFSTNSFLESEVLKTTGKAIDLSEMFTVRNIYLDKAENYVRYHGKANFSQGSLAHDVLNSYQKYGMMPESAYSGKKGKIHDHSLLVKELKSFLDSMIKSGTIQKQWELTFTNIMDEHLGGPPQLFEYEGVMYSPRTFADQVLKLDVNNYIGLTSFTHLEKGKMVNLKIPDNFSDGEYLNVNLAMMIKAIDSALARGHSVEWDGDVSEKTFDVKTGMATYLEKEKITEEKRQDEFDSYKTTDDHLMHIVGKAKDKDGNVFYVVKNSWGRKSGANGYMFFSENYMSMKTVSIYIPKHVLGALAQ